MNTTGYSALPESPDTNAAISIIKIYLDALNASAARSRRQLVFIAIASVLFLIAFWNSRQASWLNLRIRVAQDCLQEQAYEHDRGLPAGQCTLARYTDLRNYLISSGLFAEGLTDEDRRKWLEDDVVKYREVKRNSVVLVHVPFFLSVFDVNDLGLVSGLTFSLLLLGYWFSVARARDTLKHSFDVCRTLLGSSPERRQQLYNIFSTAHVLNMPLSAVNHGPPPFTKWHIRRYLGKCLVWPPFVVQLVIVLHDASTMDLGLGLNKPQTTVAMSAEVALLVIILALSIVDTWVSVQVTKKWDEEHRGLAEGEAATQS